MASQITATLPTLDFPKEVDYPTQEDWAAFSAAAELNFGILGNGWSTQMQLWKTEANAMSIELNNNADIAQSIANYQGDWTSQGYTLGQTVSVGEVYYICKLTHATGQNPTDVSSIYWNLALGNWSLKADKTEVALKVNNYGNETIAGIKTFTSFPITPSSAPTTNYQVANKKYVDDRTVASSETVSGIVELATAAEAQAGTDDIRAITPLKLRNALNATGTAPIYACRAWVNFNGTGTVAIRASGNVSSITDNGVGDYTVNFTTAVPDANYCTNCVGALVGQLVSTNESQSSPIRTTTQNKIVTGSSLSGAPLDATLINVSIFR